MVSVSCHQAEHTGLYSYPDSVTGQKHLAKYSVQYGTEVQWHAVWASVGRAPALFNVHVVGLNFNILFIRMGQSPEAWRVLNDLSDSELSIRLMCISLQGWLAYDTCAAHPLW